MRIRCLAVFAASLFFLTVFAGVAMADEGPREFEVDNVHSTVMFRIQHAGISYFYGRFNKMSGTFKLDREDVPKSYFNIEIKTSSIDTNSSKRDKHLKSPDFFNAKQFPVISFESTNVKRTGKYDFEVTGQLSLHGVTKEITLTLQYFGTVENPRFGMLSAVESTFTIKRSDFGITAFPDNLGDEVRITVSVEGKLPKEKKKKS